MGPLVEGVPLKQKCPSRSMVGCGHRAPTKTTRRKAHGSSLADRLHACHYREQPAASIPTNDATICCPLVPCRTATPTSYGYFMDNRPPPPTAPTTAADQLAKDVASIKTAVWIIAILLVLSALWAGAAIVLSAVNSGNSVF